MMLMSKPVKRLIARSTILWVKLIVSVNTVVDVTPYPVTTYVDWAARDFVDVNPLIPTTYDDHSKY
jgi:hypothetical protein